MNKVLEATAGVYILPAHLPIPMMGFLPVNAFVIKSREPVLIDTGTVSESGEFMNALESVIDPRDLRWIWLTHDDADHTGSIFKVLEAAPRARLVANALAVLRLNTVSPVPMDRVHWLNPGGSIDAGDRKLTAIRPPLFDNPTAIGIMDDKSGVFFSVDCFGGILSSQTQNVDEIAEEELTMGMTSWASADSPWVHMVNPAEYNQSLDRIRKLSPKIILSSHLPQAHGKTEWLLKVLERLPSSTPFVAPDQSLLEQILVGMKSN